MNKIIDFSKQPYRAGATLPVPGGDPISKLFFPVFDQAFLKEHQAETSRQFFLLKAALHLYKLKMGSFPQQLDQLVQANILPKLNNDPFAFGHPIKYIRNSKEYILYSVGPDGIDDGGKPIDDPSKATKDNPKARYKIDANSKGDIVLGVNSR